MDRPRAHKGTGGHYRGFVKFGLRNENALPTGDPTHAAFAQQTKGLDCFKPHTLSGQLGVVPTVIEQRSRAAHSRVSVRDLFSSPTNTVDP
jgi:hypothetical protein